MWEKTGGGQEGERREWGKRGGFYGSAEFKVNNTSLMFCSVKLKLSALNELVQLSGVKTSHLNSINMLFLQNARVGVTCIYFDTLHIRTLVLVYRLGC